MMKTTEKKCHCSLRHSRMSPFHHNTPHNHHLPFQHPSHGYPPFYPYLYGFMPPPMMYPPSAHHHHMHGASNSHAKAPQQPAASPDHTKNKPCHCMECMQGLFMHMFQQFCQGYYWNEAHCNSRAPTGHESFRSSYHKCPRTSYYRTPRGKKQQGCGRANSCTHCDHENQQQEFTPEIKRVD